MKNALHRPLLPLALATALALSACSNEEPATFEDTATEAAQAAPAQETSDEPAQEQPANSADEQAADPAGTTAAGTTAAGPAGSAVTATDDGTSEDSATAAGVNLTDLGDPIATATIPADVAGDPEATMDVSLHSLKREGSTLVANYSFTVHSEDGDDQARWIYHYLGNQGWNPFLIDTINLARHDVLSKDGIRAQTDYQGQQFRPGQTLYASASFAAPPEDVTTMTVHVVEGAPGIPDVEIQ